jgi:hypothetical protein
MASSSVLSLSEAAKRWNISAAGQINGSKAAATDRYNKLIDGVIFVV